MNFKFQTSGQSLDVVPVYDFIVEGLVLKPPMPSDARKFLDAQNNALIQWRRRGRINHNWRDRAGVPVSEETEFYEIEVLSGSTVVRTVRINPNVAQPVMWGEIIRVEGNATINIANDGTGTISHPAELGGPLSFVNSIQMIEGDFIVEFETYHDGTGLLQLPLSVGLVPTTSSGANLGAWGGSASDLTANANGQQLFVTDIPYAAGDRFAMEFIGNTFRWFKNPQSGQSPAILTEQFDLDFSPYKLQIRMTNPDLVVSTIGRGIRNPTLLRFQTADWFYSAGMQTADGLTPGDPIHLKIYQVSAQVGRGFPLEVTL